MTPETLSPEVQAALRDADTRDEVLALMLAAGAPIKVQFGEYVVRADVLIWLSQVLGLDDGSIFYTTTEED